MFDSAGKPGTGLATGNINWVGSYKQCNKIKVKKPNMFLNATTEFKGRYCRTTLGFPDNLAIPVNIRENKHSKISSSKLSLII